MSNPPSPQAYDAVHAAILAAGPAPAQVEGHRAWRKRVDALIPTVASLFREGDYTTLAWAQDVIESAPFAATFLGYEMEESSKRAIVSLDTHRPSKRYPEGIEPIRTNPSWSGSGFLVIRRIQQLAVGSEILVYKVLEATGEGADDNKVRVLVHFELISRPETGGGPTPPPESAAKAGAGRAAPAETDHTAEATAVTKALASLTNAQRIEVAKRCRAAEIPNWPQPSPEHVDGVLKIIREVSG